MSYEINVSKNGKHYFATHERSINSMEKLLELKNQFEIAFPEKEGFKLDFTEIVRAGKKVDFKTKNL